MQSSICNPGPRWNLLVAYISVVYQRRPVDVVLFWEWLLMPTRSNAHAYPRNHLVERMHVRTSLDGYGLAEDNEGMTFSFDSGML